MKIVHFWGCVLITLFTQGAQAQGWRLPDLFKAVETNHPDIMAARQLENAAQFDLEASENQRYPTLAVDRGNVSGGGRQTSIALTQPLYTFGAITKGIEVSQNKLAGAGSDRSVTVSELYLQTAALYMDALRAGARALVAKESVASHDELAEAMQRRFDAQLGNASDRDLALNRLALAKSELTQAELLEKRALSSLRILTRTDVDGVQLFNLPPERFESQANLLDSLKTASPELARSQNEGKVAKAEAEALKANQMPRVLLLAERVETTVPTPFTDNRLIASVQFTPGAGLSSLAARDAAFARALAAEQQSLSTLQTLEEDAIVLWAELELAAAEIPVLERVEASNKNIVDSFYRQFQAGKRSWVDVVNGLREYVQSRYNLIEARHRYNNAYVQAAIRGGKLDWLGKPERALSQELTLQKNIVVNDEQLMIEYSVSQP